MSTQIKIAMVFGNAYHKNICYFLYNEINTTVLFSWLINNYVIIAIMQERCWGPSHWVKQVWFDVQDLKNSETIKYQEV